MRKVEHPLVEAERYGDYIICYFEQQVCVPQARRIFSNDESASRIHTEIGSSSYRQARANSRAERICAFSCRSGPIGVVPTEGSV